MDNYEYTRRELPRFQDPKLDCYYLGLSDYTREPILVRERERREARRGALIIRQWIGSWNKSLRTEGLRNED
jgi:hypothetical protein